MNIDIGYQQTALGAEFHNDSTPHRSVMGGVGKGKSVLCIWEIFQKMLQMPLSKGVHGKKRYSRWLILRNTFSELKSTTLRDWREWFPPEIQLNKSINAFGKIKHTSPIEQQFCFNDVHADILFLPLDGIDDEAKIRGMALTGAWINESKYIKKSNVEAVSSRIARYPQLKNIYRTGILKWEHDPRRIKIKGQLEQYDEGFEPHKASLWFINPMNKSSMNDCTTFFIEYKNGNQINIQESFGQKRVISVFYDKKGRLCDFKGNFIFNQNASKEKMLKQWMGMHLNDFILAGGFMWFGTVDDTNPPMKSHWRYEYERLKKPYKWKFFNYPSPFTEDPDLIKYTDYIQHQPTGIAYWTRLCDEWKEDKINVDVHGNYGTIMDGLAVYAKEWNDKIHIESDYTPDIYRNVVLGVDFGKTPCAVFLQKDEEDIWHLFDEFVTEDTIVPEFAEKLRVYIFNRYPSIDLKRYKVGGDPAGRNPDDHGNTGVKTLQNFGFDVMWPRTNSPDLRIDVVKSVLKPRIGFEKGRLRVSQHQCLVCIEGFVGGYKYKQINKTGQGSDIYHNVPEKRGEAGKFSHTQDAIQYGLMVGGEHDRIMEQNLSSHHYRIPQQVIVDPFSRGFFN